jgi:hypothetical protein
LCHSALYLSLAAMSSLSSIVFFSCIISYSSLDSGSLDCVKYDKIFLMNLGNFSRSRIDLDAALRLSPGLRALRS